MESHTDEWEKWLSEIKGSQLNRLLTEELKILEPDRGPDAVRQLKNYILAHCFCCAEPDKVPGANWIGQLKDEDERFVERGETALRNIEELNSFIREYQAPHQALDIDLPDALATYSSNVTHLIEELRKKAFAHWQQRGALFYQKKLPPQAHRDSPQLNSLLFICAFFIRQYTDQSIDDENWLKAKTGPMPKAGKPHCRLIAQIANATGEISTHPFLPKPLTENQVKMRIQRLLANGVQLSIWPAPSAIGLKGNRVSLNPSLPKN